MLYYLFQFTEKLFHLPGGRLFQYISFRAGLAVIISLIITMWFGNRIIRSLKRLQIDYGWIDYYSWDYGAKFIIN